MSSPPLKNVRNADDHQLNPEPEAIQLQRPWLEVKLCEILHGTRSGPLIAAPLVVITTRRTYRSNYDHGQILGKTIYFPQ